jgi:hypothetical protein
MRTLATLKVHFGVRGPGRYRTLTEGDRDPLREEGDNQHAQQSREDLKAATPAPERPATPMRPPMPAPRPVGELLGQLDPDRAMRIAQIQALDDMARTGKIDWAEWGRRVRDVYRETPGAAKTDDLVEARAAAEEARAREQTETARQRADERER